MRSLFLRWPSLGTDFATLWLRLLFGGLFIYYGYQKIQGYEQYSSMFPDYIGLGHQATYILVTVSEFLGGILLVLGLLTRLAIIPIFIIMIVAYFEAHKNDPFAAKQIVFFYMLLCPVIFILGGGRFSLDRLLFGRSRDRDSLNT
jgi:putative oxidoreductase